MALDPQYMWTSGLMFSQVWSPLGFCRAMDLQDNLSLGKPSGFYKSATSCKTCSSKVLDFLLHYCSQGPRAIGNQFSKCFMR